MTVVAGCGFSFDLTDLTKLLAPMRIVEAFALRSERFQSWGVRNGRFHGCISRLYRGRTYAFRLHPHVLELPFSLDANRIEPSIC